MLPRWTAPVSNTAGRSSLGGLRHARKDSINTGWRNASFRGYADYMQTPEFAAAVDELLSAGPHQHMVFMCAEAVPWRCHRSLVADDLTVRGIPVEHIYYDARAKAAVSRTSSRRFFACRTSGSGIPPKTISLLRFRRRRNRRSRHLFPHRLQLPVSQRTPDPLKRPELEVVEPPGRNNQLRSPDHQHDAELPRPADFAEEPQLPTRRTEMCTRWYASGSW